MWALTDAAPWLIFRLPGLLTREAFFCSGALLSICKNAGRGLGAWCYHISMGGGKAFGEGGVWMGRCTGLSAGRCTGLSVGW